MGDISDTLKSIDGATDIFFCGYDGIVIEKFGSNRSIIDIDPIAANYVSAFRHLTISENQFKEIICYYEKFVVIVKLMDDGFIGIVLSLDGNIGRAKLELNKYGSVFFK